jgi:hypothetical protein
VEENDGLFKIHIAELDPEIEELWKKGDHRPEGVEVPGPVRFTERILYWNQNDGRFYDVTGNISFELNEGCDSTAVEDSVEAANEAHHDMIERNSFPELLKELLKSFLANPLHWLF